MRNPKESTAGGIEPSSVMAVLFILGFIGGTGYFIRKTITSTSPLRQEGELFFEQLRTGESVKVDWRRRDAGNSIMRIPLIKRCGQY